MCGKKAAYVAYMSIAGKHTLRQCLIGRHVGNLCDQDEIRAAGDSVALRDLGRRDDIALKGLQAFSRLRIQGDLDDGGQARAQVLRIEDGDLPLDDAVLGQAPHAPQAGGWRGVDALGQRLIGERAVLLELIQDAEIEIVEFDGSVWRHKQMDNWVRDVIYMKSYFIIAR